MRTRLTSRERHRHAWRRGRLAEKLCRLILRLKGYRIVAAPMRTPVGEVDIVARTRDTLVIVEVKARGDLAAAAAAVGARQRRRLTRAAHWIVAGDPTLMALPCRFDVMLVAPYAWPRHLINAWQSP
ncbi:MAG: YraN family protein [Azospirillaceae bacterium]|nr:YraN family protein [Azospirillaceae bacterium]